MLEVEVKYPVSDFAALERQLAEMGEALHVERLEVDQYLNAPDRDFATTDEALRVRRTGPVGVDHSSPHAPREGTITRSVMSTVVTYKGPKRDAQTKTRTEIEVPLAEGDDVADDFIRLLQHLGYRSVAVVRKRRRIYHLQRGGFDVEICLDEVADVGRFVELEIQAPEERLEAARQTLLAWAAELGFQQSERRSYLEMLLKKRGQ